MWLAGALGLSGVEVEAYVDGVGLGTVGMPERKPPFQDVTWDVTAVVSLS